MKSSKPHIDSRKSKVKPDKTPQKQSFGSENEILKEFIQEQLKIDSKEVKRIIENELLKKFLKEKLKVSAKKITQITKKKGHSLPISIFKNKLSTLEAIVRYLHEFKKLKFVQIARFLNRNERTIWHAYQRSIKKKIQIKVLDSQIKVPLSIFSDRKYSPLEILVSHLKERHNLKLIEIAVMLELSPKTIGTVYCRYKNKKNASKQ